MTYTTITQTREKRGLVTIKYNRPGVMNAMNDELIAETHDAVGKAGEDPSVRIVLFTGEGKAFSAGADLNWMKRMAAYTEEENTADAVKLAEMLRAINACPKPTMAVVNGIAMGGGVGLVSVCDISIASQNAFFALSEARLGLIPATISPFVVRAIGTRAARRYFLTAERFGAGIAKELGLVHEVVPAEALWETAEGIITDLLKGGPAAQQESKKLIDFVSDRPVDDHVCFETAKWIARIRASTEGKEGMGAFLEKRSPVWTKPD